MKKLSDRFWAKVRIGDSKDSCWEWLGYKNPGGYGRIGIGKRSDGHEIAHRVSWILHNGVIPEGMFVLHACDNRGCVNPHHLFLGTQADNVHDCQRKGRSAGGSSKGSNNPNSKLTQQEVDEIRATYKSGVMYQYQLADLYGISQAQVSLIIRRESWI
jgi:hypothetical protein